MTPHGCIRKRRMPSGRRVAAEKKPYKVNGVKFMATCAGDAMVQYLHKIHDCMVTRSPKIAARNFGLTVEKQKLEWVEI